MKYVMVFGNPFDGLNITGPFDCAEDASEYADNTDYPEYWIVALEAPETDSATRSLDTLAGTLTDIAATRL